MYYITNQTKQVIAADDSLLKLLDIENIEELSRQIILGKLHFTEHSQDSMEIATQNKTLSFKSRTSLLSSLVGDLHITSLEQVTQTAQTEEVQSAKIPSQEEQTEDNNLVVLTEDIQHDVTEPQEALSEKETQKETLTALDDDMLFIKEEETPSTFISPEETDSALDETMELLDMPESFVKEDESAKAETSEETLIELTIPQVPEETIDEITVNEPETSTPPIEEKPSPDTSPIVINISEISNNIGITTDDYKVFLNEYIDTAISLEEDLRGNDTQACSSAVGTLTQLSEVLQLPQVNAIMSEISQGSSETKDETIDAFYAILSRLVTTEEPAAQETSLQETPVEKEPQPEAPQHHEPSTEKVELDLETPILEDHTLETELPAPPKEEGAGGIDLSDVKPIHFDFQLEEAANDLSLPVELIEEFVHDFIEQAHTETEKMLKAYEKGDLDTIQKIGHMLKGASSNLRINALSDTLYQIQFCEDFDKLEGFIRQYWGHFLSFEQQINILSK